MLINCPECSKEISDSAKNCPQCGYPLTEEKEVEEQPQVQKPKKKKSNLGCIAAVVVLIVVLFMIFNSGGDSDDNKVSKKQHLTTEQIESIENLISEGILRLELPLNRAYIDPIGWNYIDYKEKENLARALSIYVGNRSDNLYWVEIYDKQSGKKLAKYSSWGFKVY